MSLFDSASLVVTPNGYKEDKLYAIKPTDGSGDLVVTRATTATRVNSDGLIEVTPYNFFTYSNTFSNAIWIKSNTSVTSGQSGYDGTLNASLLTSSANNGFIYQNSLINETNTFSIYAKAGTNTQIILYSQHSAQGKYFNLSTGTIGADFVAAPINATIESVGNGWYRCTITVSASSNSAWRIYNVTTGTSYIQNAQLVRGTSAKEYFPTTDRLDVPRLDYTNSTCPSILVEPQRTNLANYSEQFDNAFWIKTNATIILNATTSPSGNLTANKILETTTSGYHYAESIRSLTNGQTYTASCFIKKAERNFGYIGIYTNESKQIRVDLVNGTISSTAGTWVSYKLEDYGNDWYRVTGTFVATTTTYFFIGPALNSTTVIYSGNSSNGVFLWGAQLELGSNATSYIPTTSASVTRNADVISKTGISSLIGQTEGTIFVDANLSVNANERRLISVSNGTETQRIIIWTLGTTLYTSFNGVSVNLGNFPIGTTKIAVGYTISGGSTTYSIKVNNNTLITGTAAAAPNPLSAINLGNNTTSGLPLNDRVNLTTIWKTRLTNAELATLTTI